VGGDHRLRVPVEGLCLAQQRKTGGAVPVDLQPGLGVLGEQLEDVRVARVLAREQQRPEVVVEPAEARVVLGAGVGAGGVDRRELRAEESRQPAVDVELPGDRAGQLRLVAADRGDQLPARGGMGRGARGRPGPPRLGDASARLRHITSAGDIRGSPPRVILDEIVRDQAATLPAHQ
jgi:hypothetical protein